MALKVTVEGLATLRDRLRAVRPAIEAALAPQLARGAAAVAADAKAFAPVRTGTLRAGIRATGSGLRHAAGVTGPATAYAHFVEYGTSRMPARPFMRAAAQREEARLPGRTRTVAAALPGEVRRG
jgi:HK97 gp10 family phage protein